MPSQILKQQETQSANQGKLEKTIAHLDTISSELKNATEELYSRLSPVSIPPRPQVATESTLNVNEESQSYMEDRVDEITTKIRYILSVVYEAIDNLRV